MFDARGALVKVMSRTARSLTPGLRKSCTEQGWPDEAVVKMAVRLRREDLVWYADYKGSDAKPALDLEYGDGDEPPKPGIYNYFESSDTHKRAEKLMLTYSYEFGTEIERLVSRL